MIKVLLIEDNEDHVHFVESSLDKKKFKLTTLSDGKQALDYLLHSGEKPDVVLLDYYIPIVDGLQVLKKIHEAVDDFAFIFLTVDTSVETAVEAMKAGALDFIPKTERFYDGLPAMIEKVHGIHKTNLEKKKIEEELLESEEKYRQLFSTESDAIMLFDSKTKQFIDINKSCELLYGYSKEEFLNLKIADISNEPEDAKGYIKKSLEGKFDRISIRYHKKKDGTIFPVDISVSTFKLH